MIVGLDASNLRSGGAITHAVAFLNECEKSDKNKYIVWGSKKTLKKVKNAEFIEKIYLEFADKNLFYRFFFQTFLLSTEAKKKSCDVLFIPGGTFLGRFKPFVTMCRNMLPFEKIERDRYIFSLRYFKLHLLKIIQLVTFKRSDGIIFLTNFAKQNIERIIPSIDRKSIIIPHGVNPEYFISINNKNYKNKNYTFRCVYTSTIDHYKHQDKIIRAIKNLNDKGIKLKIDIIGSQYDPALRKFLKVKKEIDPENKIIQYRGPLDIKSIKKIYSLADFLIFASSCENLPNILLEKMATGLPIACSKKRPMIDILGKNGVYFDYNSISDIETCIKKIINSLKERKNISMDSRRIAKTYTWEKSKKKTIRFIKEFV